MTPAYLYELADLADPEQLWRLPGMKQLDLPPAKRRQLDAGVALRRYARDIEQLRALLGTGNSLLVSPLSPNSRATKTVKMPPDHRRLLPYTAQELIDSHRKGDDALKKDAGS